MPSTAGHRSQLELIQEERRPTRSREERLRAVNIRPATYQPVHRPPPIRQQPRILAWVFALLDRITP